MDFKLHKRITQIDALGVMLLIVGAVLIFINNQGIQLLESGHTIFVFLVCILSLPLVFHRCFSNHYSKFFNIYVYIAVTYSLPFFFTYMYFNNQDVKIWSLLLIASFVILTQYIKFQKLGLIIFCGCFVASLMSGLNNPAQKLPDNVLTISLCCFILILYFSYFSTKILREHEEKIQLMKSFGMIIAHELRTPIASIKAGSLGIEAALPILIDAYNKAATANLIADSIDTRCLTALKNTTQHFQHICTQTSISINIFLKNISKDSLIETSLCKAKTIILQSIEEYPLSFEDRNKISYDLKFDFTFLGNDNTIKHVIFNLLRNAFFHLRGTPEDKVTIFTTETDNFNQIIFTDNGYGIDPPNLPYIFDKFFSSNKLEGTGLGLHFCKNSIEQFGGEIECTSKLNQYTKFIISLPKT